MIYKKAIKILGYVPVGTLSTRICYDSCLDLYSRPEPTIEAGLDGKLYLCSYYHDGGLFDIEKIKEKKWTEKKG